MGSKKPLSSQSVVLVSGGARGITGRCVVELAQRAQCKFILLGRTEVDEPLPQWAREAGSESALKQRIMEQLKAAGETPTPLKIQKTYRALAAQREIEDTLESVRQAGGQVEYVSVDITDGKALQDRLTGPVFRLGKVTGVIHGAGALADKRIEKKTLHDFETVYSPKVDGLANLLEVAAITQLDFLVLFSSVVGVYGNVGQADYAIANEVLNKSALLLQRRNPDCHVVSINWGPWEAGMVTPELKKAFEQRGIEVIPLEAGARMLVNELLPRDESSTQVVVGKFPSSLPPADLAGEMKQYQIRRKIRLELNPFLLDHQIGERPVLPATCAATWVVNACEQLYPGYKFLSMNNYQVLKGIVFDDSLADEYVLDLKETEKANSQIYFEALISSKNKQGRIIYHYKGGVRLTAEIGEPFILPLPDHSDPGDQEVAGSVLYQDGTLFHGPAFQGVEKVLHVSQDRLVMRLCLPREERIQGQFPVQNKSNPYIYDAIVQILLIWTQVYHQAPCLPSALEKIEQYGNIPFEEPCLVSLSVRTNSPTSVVGDIMAQDYNGRVFVRFMGLEGTISPLLKRLIKPPQRVEKP